ncbi:RING-H2 finger protein ATL44 [Trichinella spiralis]|uniref:RING-H2 finger protein ATL44 n=1 Tax=Trichinella spiralis TaxID=6334 RepID=A0A0V1B530_TRISP|nr:RING-H2 finger protein ATL44 [Trichinella spiralis]KRY31724.1 RING-H2 finger protein ATL44 [Trichinella spiralis]
MYISCRKNCCRHLSWFAREVLVVFDLTFACWVSVYVVVEIEAGPFRKDQHLHHFSVPSLLVVYKFNMNNKEHSTDESNRKSSSESDIKSSDESDIKSSDESDVKSSDEFDVKSSDEFDVKSSDEFDVKSLDDFDGKSSDDSDSAKYSPYDDLTSSEETESTTKQIKRKSSQMNESNSEIPCKKQTLQETSPLVGDNSPSLVTPFTQTEGQSYNFRKTPIPSSDSEVNPCGDLADRKASQNSVVMSTFDSSSQDTYNSSSSRNENDSSEGNLADISAAMYSDNSAIHTEHEISESDSVENANVPNVEDEIHPPRSDADTHFAVAEDLPPINRSPHLVTYREEENSQSICDLENPGSPREQGTDYDEPITAVGSDFESHAFSPDDTSYSPEAPIVNRPDPQRDNYCQNERVVLDVEVPSPPLIPMYLNYFRVNPNVVYPEWASANVPVQQRHYLARQREQLERRRNMHARWLHERARMRSMRNRMRGRAYGIAHMPRGMFRRNADIYGIVPHMQALRDLREGRMDDRFLQQEFGGGIDGEGDDSDGELGDANDFFIGHGLPVWDMDNRLMMYPVMDYEDLPQRGANRMLIANTTRCTFYNVFGDGMTGRGSNDQNEGFCVICLTAIDHDEFIRILPCGHFYHVACIDRWLIVNNSCAICRRPL